MTLEEAIEIKSAEQQATLRPHNDPLFIADQLGIEAMKHLRERRIVHPMGNISPLQGETEE